MAAKKPAWVDHLVVAFGMDERPRHEWAISRGSWSYRTPPGASLRVEGQYDEVGGFLLDIDEVWEIEINPLMREVVIAGGIDEAYNPSPAVRPITGYQFANPSDAVLDRLIDYNRRSGGMWRRHVNKWGDDEARRWLTMMDDRANIR